MWMVVVVVVTATGIACRRSVDTGEVLSVAPRGAFCHFQCFPRVALADSLHPWLHSCGPLGRRSVVSTQPQMSMARCIESPRLIGDHMDLKLENKLCIVSGSSKGIGLAAVVALLDEGARVVLNGRSEKSVAAGIQEARKATSRGKVEGFVGDLADAKVAEGLFRKYPEADVLVNNLGIFEPKPFEKIPDEDWVRFFDVNVLSGVRLSRLYLPGMLRRNWGRIVFVSSESGVQIPSEMIHYGMTKTAQLAVSRGLAELCAGTEVTVNAVLPGPTRSAGVDEFVSQISGGQPFEAFEKEFFRTVRPSSLLKRFARAEEVAAMIAYVCSPLASATNGAALRVDGGVVKSCV